jgi:hypothetical protein
MLNVPPEVGVKLQLIVSDTYAADGTLLEWLSVSEGSSDESSSDESEFSDVSDSIMVSDTDQKILFKSDLVKQSKIRDAITLFESGPTEKDSKKPIETTPKPVRTPNIREKINQFNKPERRKSSIHSHDSGVSSSALTMSATSFNSRSVSLTSNSNSEGEDKGKRLFAKRKARSSSAHNILRDSNRRNTIRSASTTSIERRNVFDTDFSFGRLISEI